MSNPTSTKRRYEMSARAEEAARTRERLLDAAMSHFAARPFEEVRLSDVAAEAGVSVPTLHAHFHSKDQLFVSAYSRWGLAQMASREAAPVGDPRRAVEILFDHYEAHGDSVLRVLAQEERIEAIKAMTDAGRVLHREWVARTFAPILEGLTGKARRERRLSALVVATDLLVWKLLRREMGKSRREAERIVVEMIAGPG